MTQANSFKGNIYITEGERETYRRHAISVLMNTADGTNLMCILIWLGKCGTMKRSIKCTVRNKGRCTPTDLVFHVLAVRSGLAGHI